jgi:Na+-transporting NADH:ubiquinone oxidoreductase subunit NqrE
MVKDVTQLIWEKLSRAVTRTIGFSLPQKAIECAVLGTGIRKRYRSSD